MSRRGLLIALIASLAVNLFVLGGLAGVALRGFPIHRPPPQSGPPRLVALGEVLTPAQRDAWQAAIRQTAETGAPKLLRARQVRRDAWRDLTADPVNPQAALAALDQARRLEFQARSEMDRAVVGFAATLPVDERRKLGEALSKNRRGPPMEGWSGGRPALDGKPPLPDR
ncbi:periplasmic heavy metal sensor [Phenylobacterium sp. LjRoot225]|uniref:periplasmic heavy metal sensor n=1 Tax=Phenylobacterium sp. LjRoot225 TaxID=3342285 RepID=UPI003ECEB1B6